MGAFFNCSHCKTALEKYIDMPRAQREKIYFVDAPDACDICKCSFEEEKFMVDGQMRDHDAWAFMCADCFIAHGKKIAWGYGQLYKKDEKGWLLVGGFFTDEHMNEL